MTVAGKRKRVAKMMVVGIRRKSKTIGTTKTDKTVATTEIAAAGGIRAHGRTGYSHAGYSSDNSILISAVKWIF